MKTIIMTAVMMWIGFGCTKDITKRETEFNSGGASSEQSTALFQAGIKEKGAAQRIPSLQRGKSPIKPVWWNKSFNYRIGAVADSGMYDRVDALAFVELNMVDVLKQLEPSNAWDENSLRVVEHGEDGQIIAERASRFIPSNTGGAPKAQKGTLVWRLPGKTESLTQRWFYIYFDTRNNGIKEKAAYADAPCPDGAIPGKNILENPGFEDADDSETWKPAVWECGKSGPEQVQRTSECAHRGKYSLKLCSNAPGLAVNQTVPVKPNAKYVISGWVKVVSADGNVAGTLTCWYGAEQGKPMPGNYKTQTDIRSTCDWMQISSSRVCYNTRGTTVLADITLPETSKGNISCSTYTANNTVMYFDDIEFREAVPGGVVDVKTGKPEQYKD